MTEFRLSDLDCTYFTTIVLILTPARIDLESLAPFGPSLKKCLAEVYFLSFLHLMYRSNYSHINIKNSFFLYRWAKDVWVETGWRLRGVFEGWVGKMCNHAMSETCDGGRWIFKGKRMVVGEQECLAVEDLVDGCADFPLCWYSIH